MANNDNLKGHTFRDRSAEEVRAMQSRGGKKSGETRRRKKLLRECLEILMEKDAGRDSEGNKVTTVEAMSIAAVKGAMNGDWKAWELVRDTLGQKPVDKVMISEVEQDVIEEVEQIVAECEKDD